MNVIFHKMHPGMMQLKICGYKLNFDEDSEII